jgi:hypothetical protein
MGRRSSMAQRSLELEGWRRRVLQSAIVEFEVDLCFVQWPRRPPRPLLFFLGGHGVLPGGGGRAPLLCLAPPLDPPARGSQ